MNRFNQSVRVEVQILKMQHDLYSLTERERASERARQREREREREYERFNE